MGDIKIKVDHAKLKTNKYGEPEHETASEPFKPAYTMTSERSAGYLSKCMAGVPRTLVTSQRKKG